MNDDPPADGDNPFADEELARLAEMYPDEKVSFRYIDKDKTLAQVFIRGKMYLCSRKERKDNT